jgi:hypothetical protein
MRFPFYFLIWYSFDRHCKQRHYAYYDVCGDPLCRLAYWVERVTLFQERMNGTAWHSIFSRCPAWMVHCRATQRLYLMLGRRAYSEGEGA